MSSKAQEEEDQQEQQSFDTLVLSGGGIYGMAHLGVCLYLENQSRFQSIRRFIGTSAGALIAMLLAMRFPIRAIEEYLAGREFYEMVFGIRAISRENAIFEVRDSLSAFIDHTFTCSKLPPTPQKMSDLDFVTLQKCFDTELCVTAVDVKHGFLQLFSIDTTPNVRLVDAVTASLCHPEFFPPVRVGSSYYIDGGVMYNFPIAEAPGATTFGILIDDSDTAGPIGDQSPSSEGREPLETHDVGHTSRKAGLEAHGHMTLEGFAHVTHAMGLDMLRKPIGPCNGSRDTPQTTTIGYLEEPKMQLRFLSKLLNDMYLRYQLLQNTSSALKATVLKIPQLEGFHPYDLFHDRKALHCLLLFGFEYAKENLCSPSSSPIN